LDKIKKIRKARKMTQTELARRAGVSQPHIYDLENGNRRASPETLKRIAEALGVTVQELQDTQEGS
jgi:transcriptional regulator with XRE-family HTH domain